MNQPTVTMTLDAESDRLWTELVASKASYERALDAYLDHHQVGSAVEDGDRRGA